MSNHEHEIEKSSTTIGLPISVGLVPTIAQADNGYNTKGFTSGIPVWEYLQENPDKADIVILDKMMYDLSSPIGIT